MAEIFLQVPSRILQGVNETNRLGIEISKQGKRALLITEPGLKDSSRKLQSLLEGHGIGTIVFDEQPLKGTSFTVETCQNLARGSHVESIVALGGGRTIAIARAVASSVPEGLHPDTMMERSSGGGLCLPCFEVISDFWIPQFFQPRFALTGSRDGSSGFIDYHSHSASIVVCDPVQSLSLPERSRTPLFFELLLNSLVCAVFPDRSFLSEVHSLSAFRRLWKRRKSLISGWDLDCAGDLMEAGFLTAMAHQESGIYWTTVLVQSLSGHFQVNRSIAAMLLLPFILDYLSQTSISELSDFLSKLGDLDDAPGSPDELVADVRELIGWYSMPSQLRSTGVTQDSLAIAAESAGQMMSRLGIGGVTVDQMFNLLKNSW